MREVFLTILRDASTDRKDFRLASHQLTHLLAHEALSHLKTVKKTIQVPLDHTQGMVLDRQVVLAPILRSGITMLPAFLTYFPEAPIAVIGIRRDEKTAQPIHYYANLPPISDHYVIVLDPMLATGGTAAKAIEVLKDAGAHEATIIFVGIVSSPEGIEQVKHHYPTIKFILAAQDAYLTKNKLIYPGLGDFGDRFFGTEQ